MCQVEPCLLELAAEPAITGHVAPLIGPDLDVFGTKFLPKLPGGGSSTHWHQDNYYFATISAQVLSCGIYLEEADRDNGCLRVVPRSHLRAWSNTSAIRAPTAVGARWRTHRPSIYPCRPAPWSSSRLISCTVPMTTSIPGAPATARPGIVSRAACTSNASRAGSIRTGTRCAAAEAGAPLKGEMA
ncbi:MAG: phytanoyl-CoA dioxygenase family protein [Candidatus Handelsmanbacteria bacterium]|nr:phytanoyl-CoA dioxygenase family protein [Candidatus Handelsmanbacteria bacterium]